MAALLRAHGVPRALPEYRVSARGVFVGRVDFAYPELKLAIEVDGFEPHTALDVFRKDRARQNDLVSSGWTVLRYVWRDVNAMAWHVAWEIERTRADALRPGRSCSRQRKDRIATVSLPRTWSLQVPSARISEKPASTDLAKSAASGIASESVLIPMQQVPQCESSVTFAAVPDSGPNG